MNFNSKNVLLIGLLIFIIGIGAVSAADADNVVVSDSGIDEIDVVSQSNFEDTTVLSESVNSESEFVNESYDDVVGVSAENADGDVLSAYATSFGRLQQCITDTENGGVLELDTDYTYQSALSEDVALKMGIIINKPITIDGKGHTISGSNGARIFNVTANNVVFKNITFNNGFVAMNTSLSLSARSGGAIWWQGDNAKVINCTFYYNRVYGNDLNYDSRGGAIYWTGKYFTAIDSTFRGPSNQIMARSGAGIHVTGSYINITNCTFDTLRTYQTAGGAIRSDGNGNVNVTITQCKFIKTWNSDTRSAIYIQNKENIFIYNNTFDGWYGYSGLVYLYGNQNHVLVSNNTFKDFGSSYHGIFQSDDNRYLWDCNITNNIIRNATPGEYIMYIAGSPSSDQIIIAHNTFEDVVCRGTGASGLMLIGNNIEDVMDVRIYNNTFTNISSVRWGVIRAYGSIYVENNTFTNCSLSATNAYTSQGTAITVYKYAYVKNNNFTGHFYDNNPNIAQGVFYISETGSADIIGNNFTNNNVTTSASMRTGLIHNDGNNTSIINNKFQDSNCTGSYGGFVYNRGNNVVIDNNNFTNSFAAIGGVIYSSGENVNITNNNVTNCYAEEEAGAFYVIGENANISNNNFTDTHADKYGAIYCDADGSTISNNIYYNNYANDNGILAIGSGVTADFQTFNENWCYGFGGNIMIIGDGNALNNIDINDSYAVSGGAIYNTGKNNNLNTVFINNSVASDYGGAIYSTGDGLTINGLEVYNTNAGIDGGAVYNAGADSELTQAVFDEVYADNNGGAIFWSGARGTLSYVNITNCIANGDGGAVYWSGADGTIYNLTVRDVYAVAGGAFYCVGSNTKLYDSIFEDIRTTSDGGAVYWTGSGANLTSISFKNINSSSNGGAIYGTAVDSFLNDLTFEDINATGSGGAVNWAGARSALYNLTFVNVNSNAKGGALYFTGDKSSFKKGKFNDITADGDGGAIYWTGSDSNMSELNFTNCFASDMGGAIYLTGSTCILFDANFTDNTADSGGAILWNAPNGQLYNVNFTNNIAFGNGGAVYLIGNNATLHDLDMFYNSATFKGGAINIIGNNATLYNIFACNNSADVDGGAIILDGSYGSLKDSKLINNTAVTNGGALNWAGVKGILSNVVFENNTGGIGGAVYWSSDDADISDVNFTSNNASTAGAVYMGGLSGGKLVNGTFTDNNASNYGGAVYWSGSDGVLLDSKFNGANAFDGGAIYWTGNGAALDNLTFDNVSAIANGGILYISASIVNVSNVDFFNSNASSGGAIYCTGASCILTNVTFENNSALTYGGAVYWMGNGAVMTNMNFTNNTADIDGGALYIISYGANMNNIRVLNNTASNYGGGIYWAGTGDISNAVFEYNRAFSGSAIYNGGSLSISNAVILRNKANMSSFDIIKNETNIAMVITVVVRGHDNFINGIWTTSNNILVRNVTYWGANGETTSQNTWVTPVRGVSDVTLYIDTALPGIPLNVTYTRGGAVALNYTNVTNVCGNYTYRGTKLPQGDYDVNVVHEDDEYYTGYDGCESISVGAINPALEVSLSSNEIYYDTEVEITAGIVVADSSGVPMGVWGKVDFYIDDIFINLTGDVADGSCVINTKLPPQFKVGLHNITGCFRNGTDKDGHPITVSVNNSTYYFTIVKNMLPTVLEISTNSSIFYVGDEVNITISGPAPYVGDITYVAGNVNGTCKLVNGTFSFLTTYLDNGTVNVLAYVGGDDNYLPSSAYYSFNIIKRDLNITIKNVTDGKLSPVSVGDEVAIELDVNVSDLDGSYVVVKVGDREYAGIIDGSSILVTISDLSEGEYNVSALYVGNNKYNSYITDNVSLTVNKIDIDSIDVVADAYVISVGDTVSFEITLNPAKYSVNDYVVVSIGDKNYKVSINNNVGKLTVQNLTNGTYDMGIIFNGNDQFNNKTVNISGIVTVNRVDTGLSIIPLNPEIYVGEDAVFDIIVDSDKYSVNGFVTVTLNNNEYNVSIVGGRGLLNVSALPYSADSYDVTAVYAGNNQFVNSTANTSIRVDKRDIASVTTRLINKPVYIGEDASLEIILRSGRYPVNGFVTVKVDNREFNVSVIDGVALLNVSGLAYSDDYYTVDVFFAGNEEFNGYTELAATDIIIKKVDINEINLTSNSPINVGDEAVFNINMTSILPDKYVVNTIITVKINGKDYNVSISNNTGSLIIPDLAAGVHDIFVSFAGDAIFNRFNNYSSNPIASITVNKIPTKVDMNDVTINVGNPAVIIARVNNTEVTGNITFTVDNKVYTKGVVNGVASLNIAGLNTSSNTTIVAQYSGDDKYLDSSATANLIISKVSDQPIISVYDIVAGQVESVVIALPSDVTNGTITVKFNDEVLSPQDYSIENNVIIFDRTIQTADTYSVEIAVDNDAKYYNMYASKDFTVSKNDNYKISVNMGDFVFGEDIELNVVLPSDAEGDVIINGVIYSVEDARNGVVLPANDGAGDYSVNVTYANDDKYANKTVIVNYTVPKASSSVSININEVFVVGEDIHFTVTAVNSTGDITVTINDEVYHPANATEVTISGGLANATYNVIVKLDGDSNYTASETSKVIYVNKNAVSIVLDEITGSFDVGDEVTLTARFNKTVSGDVIFTVNGVNYTVSADNVDNVNYKYVPQTNGTYVVTAFYSGNDKYNANSTAKSISFSVDKVLTDLIITVDPINVGEDAVINVEVIDNEATGIVNVKINGKSYDVALNDGKGNITISGLTTATDNNIIAVYSGDNKYNSSMSISSVAVSKVSINSIVVSPDDLEVHVGETPELCIKLNPADSGYLVNDYVTVNVNNKDYNVSIINNTGYLKLPSLNEGQYPVSVYYAGSTIFNPIEEENIIVITSRKVDIKSIEVTPSSQSVYVGDEIPLNVNVISELDNYIVNGSAVVNVAGKNYTISIVDGKGALKIPTLNSGDYKVSVYYTEDNTFNSYSKLNNASIHVDKIPVSITVKPLDQSIFVGSDAVLNVTVECSERDYLINGYVNATVNGRNYNVSIINGNGSLILRGLTNGTYNIAVTYNGDNTFLSVDSAASLTVVNKIPTSIHMEDVTIKVGDVANIEAEINTTEATGNVTFIVNNIEYTVGIINGIAKLNVSNLNTSANMTITAKYSGDYKYLNSTATAELHISKVDGNATISVHNITADEMENIIVKLPADISNATVKLYLDNVEVTDYVRNNNLISLNRTIQASGNYSVKITVSDDCKYNDFVNETVFTVSKVRPEDYAIEIDVNNTSVFEMIPIIVRLPSDANETLMIFVDGDMVNSTVTVNNGIAYYPLENQSSGNHTITVMYSDAKYDVKLAETVVYVAKIASNISIVNPQDPKVAHEITIGLLPEGSTGNITVTINNKTYEVQNKTVDASDLKEGSYTVVAVLDGDDNYLPSQATSTFTVTRNDVTAVLNPVSAECSVGYPVTLHVDFNESVSGDVVFNINNANYTVSIRDSMSAEYVWTPLNDGEVAVSASYSGNDTYYPANTSVIGFEVFKNSISFINVSVDDIMVEETAYITVFLNESDATGLIVVKVNGTDYEGTISNGSAVVNVKDLPAGNYTAVAFYGGDNKYLSSNSMNASFIVNRYDAPVEINVSDIMVLDDAVVHVFVPEEATGYVAITVDNQSIYLPVIDGAVSWTVSNLSAGNYTVEASYSGDNKYSSNTSSVVFTVFKYESQTSINASDIWNDEDEIIKVTVPYDATGNVSVIINNETYTAPVENGTAVFTFSNLDVGNYTVEALYSGDYKYLESANTSAFIVNLNYSIIEADDLTKYYKGSERLIFNLTNARGDRLANETVTVNINGITYTRTTNANGAVSMPVNLPTGEYEVTISYAGHSDYDAAVKVVNVTVMPTIVSSDLTKVYRNDSQYWAYFTDSKGNPLVNTTVTFNINGVMYNRMTNESGWAKLNINLPQGEYIITAYNPVTDERRSNNITVFANIVENNDLTKVYGDPDKFTVRIIGDDGQPAGAGEKVQFNINGVIYTRSTNATGYASLNINLPPGEYIITTYYLGCTVSNKVTVLSKD